MIESSASQLNIQRSSLWKEFHITPRIEPLDRARWVASNEHIRWNVARDDCARAHDAARANGHARQHHHPRPQPRAVTYRDWREAIGAAALLRRADLMCPRQDHHIRTKMHTLANGYRGVERDSTRRCQRRIVADGQQIVDWATPNQPQWPKDEHISSDAMKAKHAIHSRTPLIQHVIWRKTCRQARKRRAHE